MALKSAYELAMERMAKHSQQPARKLAEKDKARLAELDRVYTAKIAEQELALKPRIAEARARGEVDEAQKLGEKLRAQVQRLRSELEDKKEAVRRRRCA